MKRKNMFAYGLIGIMVITLLSSMQVDSKAYDNPLDAAYSSYLTAIEVMETYGDDFIYHGFYTEDKLATDVYRVDKEIYMKKLALEIVGDATSDYEKAKRILKYVRTHIVYGGGSYGHMRVGYDVLTQKGGVCEDFTLLTKELCIYAGIKTLQVGIDVVAHSINIMEVDGEWIFADPTGTIELYNAKEITQHIVNSYDTKAKAAFISIDSMNRIMLNLDNYYFNLGYKGVTYQNKKLQCLNREGEVLTNYDTCDSLGNGKHGWYSIDNTKAEFFQLGMQESGRLNIGGKVYDLGLSQSMDYFTFTKPLATHADMKVGVSKKLEVIFDGVDRREKITWQSNKEDVVSVDASGRATARKPGDASISAISNTGFKATIDIHVNIPENVETPELYNLKFDNEKTKLEWSNVHYATGYNIYRYNVKTKQWDYIKGTTGTTTTLANESKDQMNYYKVRAFYKDVKQTKLSNFSNTKSGISLTPSKIIKTTANGNGIFIEWMKSPKATAYNLYRYNENTRVWEFMKATTGLTTTDRENITIGKEYYYMIRPYLLVDKVKYFAAYSPQMTGIIVERGELTKIGANQSSQIKLEWAKSTGASGYNVYRYNPSTRQWDYQASVTNNRSYLDTKTVQREGYQYRVRPYKKLKDGRIIYGEYSNVLFILT